MTAGAKRQRGGNYPGGRFTRLESLSDRERLAWESGAVIARSIGLKLPRRTSGPIGGLPPRLAKIEPRPEKDLSLDIPGRKPLTRGSTFVGPV